jgi:hypothetical protein
MIEFKVINSIGLILGTIGVLLIFIWGPPQPNLNKGIGLGLEDNTPIDSNGKTVKEHNNEIEIKRKKHYFLSRLGLASIFFGFLFQLWATLL